MERDDPLTDGALASDRSWWRWPVLAALLAVLVGAVWLPIVLWPRSPADDSADAGFARDMSFHHAQAVEMAGIVYLRTQDPIIRTSSYDILTSQQAQIGMFMGWLDTWGLPATGSGPAMAWMGRPAGERMPGLATKVEVASLTTLPTDQMDVEFLRLMIRHHQGGVLMAEAGAADADEEVVRIVAGGIAKAQRVEIGQMQNQLTRRGVPAVPDLPETDHDMAAMARNAEERGGHEEGFTAGIGDVLRRSLIYLPLSIGLFALGWLVVDALARARETDPSVEASSPRLVATGALLASAVLHAGLAPEHFDERTSFGLFFAGSTVAMAFLAAVLLAWPSPPTYLVGAAVALLLIVVWTLFRLVPPPGADETETVNLIGLVTTTAEIVACVACLLLWRRTAESYLLGAAADRA